MNTWGLDVSTYQQVDQKYKMMKDNGATFCIVRAGQGTFYDDKVDLHSQTVKDAGLVLGHYFWVDPLVKIQTQADNFQAKIDQWDVSIVAPDFEQWWASWAEWELAVQGKMAWADVKKLSPTQINDAYWGMYDILSKRNKFVMSYTGLWFIYGYSPAMLPWVTKHPTWLADYSYITQNNIHNCPTWPKWDQLLTDLPSVDPNKLFIYNNKSTLALHQFTSSTLNPSVIYNTDFSKLVATDPDIINIFMGNVQPGTAYKVLVDELPGRTVPHQEGCVTSLYKLGDTIYLESITAPWGKVANKEEYIHVGNPTIERL